MIDMPYFNIGLYTRVYDLGSLIGAIYFPFNVWLEWGPNFNSRNVFNRDKKRHDERFTDFCLSFLSDYDPEPSFSPVFFYLSVTILRVLTNKFVVIINFSIAPSCQVIYHYFNEIVVDFFCCWCCSYFLRSLGYVWILIRS